MVGRKPTIERKQGDLVKTPTRLPEILRDQLKAAAEDNGRSMNAEIIHRLEDHERARQAADLLNSDPALQRFVMRVIQTRMNAADGAAHLRSSGEECSEHEELFNFYLNISSAAGGDIMELTDKLDRPPPRLPLGGSGAPQSPIEILNRIEWEINAHIPRSDSAKAEYIQQIKNTQSGLVSRGMDPEKAADRIGALIALAGRQFGLTESKVAKILAENPFCDPSGHAAALPQ